MTKLFISPTMFQILCKHLASYSIIHDGRGEVHLYRTIQLIQSLIPEEEIKKDYGLEKYKEVQKLLLKFGKIVFKINSYFDLLKDSDFINSKIYKEAYREYLFALSELPIIYPNIIRYFSYLIKLTSLSTNSIPSEYLNQASKDVIDFSSEKLDMGKRIENFKYKNFLSKQKEEFIEEDDN